MTTGTPPPSPAAKRPPCEGCGKPADLCVCDQLRPLEHRHRVLILQHPQEPDKILGSAWLAHRCLPGSILRVGLSWPNLAKALGEPRETVQPSRWAVLYLGSGIKGVARPEPGLHFVTKSGAPAPRPEALDGFVVLDGTWSQAKAIWWRNAWLLKLKRAILVPREPSLYKELRREPRRECLSTIETIAGTLAALGEPESTSRSLKGVFAELLDRQRARLRNRRGA